LVFSNFTISLAIPPSARDLWRARPLHNTVGSCTLMPPPPRRRPHCMKASVATAGREKRRPTATTTTLVEEGTRRWSCVRHARGRRATQARILIRPRAMRRRVELRRWTDASPGAGIGVGELKRSREEKQGRRSSPSLGESELGHTRLYACRPPGEEEGPGGSLRAPPVGRERRGRRWLHNRPSNGRAPLVQWRWRSFSSAMVHPTVGREVEGGWIRLR
jgi:hypothetical protein